MEGESVHPPTYWVGEHCLVAKAARTLLECPEPLYIQKSFAEKLFEKGEGRRWNRPWSNTACTLLFCSKRYSFIYFSSLAFGFHFLLQDKGQCLLCSRLPSYLHQPELDLILRLFIRYLRSFMWSVDRMEWRCWRKRSERKRWAIRSFRKALKRVNLLVVRWEYNVEQEKSLGGLRFRQILQK